VNTKRLTTDAQIAAHFRQQARDCGPLSKPSRERILGPYLGAIAELEKSGAGEKEPAA
jgi:hypothetical protein